jgi:hypothetical protein
MRKILKNYNSEFDLKRSLVNELKISNKKAEMLADRLDENFDFEKLSLLINRKEQIRTEETKKEEKTKFNIYSLDSLSGKEFEDFLRWMFQELGYAVELTKVTADSGVDLVVKKDKDKIAIQAKRFNRNTKVSNNVVLKTHGGMGIYKCNKSMIITTSYYTNQAMQDAKKLDIELWDRDILSAKIDEINNYIEKIKQKVEFPDYAGSLYKSLLELKSMGIFIVQNKGKGKYDIYRRGVKYPLLSFRQSFNQISHLSFRIKNSNPIPEYGPNSWVLIISDRGSVYGPTGKSAYDQIIQYLSQFV